MLPKSPDARQALAGFAYSLGLGSQPARSSHSYIEKAEYWALVWGTIVMAPGPYSYTLDRTTVGLMLSVRTARGKLSLIPIPTTRGVSTDETV